MVTRVILCLSLFLLCGWQGGHRTHGISVKWKAVVTSTSTGNTTTYATTSFQMHPTKTYLVAVGTTDAAGLTHTHSLASGHTSPTWTQIITRTFNTSASPTQRLSLWKGTTAGTEPSSGTLTNTTSDAATGCLIAVYELTGTAAASSLVVQSNSVATSGADPSLALGATVDQGRDNMVIYVVGGGVTPAAATHVDWNASEANDITHASPTSGMAVYFCERTEKTTAKVTRSSAEYGALVAEIKKK